MRSTLKGKECHYAHDSISVRFNEPIPAVILPNLPFSWEAVSDFKLENSGPFQTIISEQSKPAPQQAYAWWESLTYLMNRAVSSTEAVPLVELIQHYGRFGATVRAGAISLVRNILSHEQFLEMELSSLFEQGMILPRGGASFSNSNRFLSVPREYLAFLNPVLRYHPWDESVLPTMCVVDQQGIAYIVLANHDCANSKYRKREFDGLQAIANSIWKEARTDIFDIPICCCVEYLCFRIIAAPLQFWLPHEEPLFPYLSYDLIRNDPNNLWQWESSNPDVIEALAQISQTIPGSTLPYLVRQSPPPETYIDDDVSSLLISSCRQKLVPYCPIDLLPNPSPAPSDQVLTLVADKITNFECLITSPIVLRSLLREHSIKVRYIGMLLLKLQLPVMKQIIVSEMVSRRAKWFIRKQLYDQFIAGQPVNRIDIESLFNDETMESNLIKSASEYFNVPIREIEPFYKGAINFFLCNYVASGVDIPENRSLFPQYHYLDPLIPEVPGFFPKLKIVYPNPAPYIDVNKAECGHNPIDYLPLKYASLVYRLETAFSIGDVFEAIVVIGDLAMTIMRMIEIEPVEENKKLMQTRILSLCIAARDLCPLGISVPTSVIQSIIDCVPSLKLYEDFRMDVIEKEGKDTITVLSLDNQMAKCVFETHPEQAIPILKLCSERCERSLGARHLVTVASWIRLGQAIKKTLETNSNISFDEKLVLIREAIKCLNKAEKAADFKVPKQDFMLDHSCFAHYLLSIFYLWNGEPGKAVDVSRQGLEVLSSHYSFVHPRYLNSAFLHAKLLEKYASSTDEPHVATAVAREARDLLEEILDALLDLTDESGNIVDEFFTVDAYLGGIDQFDRDLDIRRKLAITALIIKMNIWLLDPPTAKDLLDLVVADYLTGSRGILDLPRRMAVRDAVVYVIDKRTEDLRKVHSQTLPVLEMTTVLPEPVMGCLNMALQAKANGMKVTDWFHEFREKTMMTIGDGPGTESSQFRDLLTEVFLTFVYIESDDCVFIGPLSSPIVPRNKAPERITSQGEIYRRWERSATLYTIDHGLYPINGNPLWNGRVPRMTRAAGETT